MPNEYLPERRRFPLANALRDRISDLSTSLAWVPVPPEDEIASQREFEVLPLSAEEFEEVWRRAIEAS
ncbi:hypothetical protein [Kribbella sp. VKM Ac-2500]|uniref:DUF6881 domain-containing protein n=1 Tax=Kribbella sp. VKM Ac-2500 TaxID=2512214 RepID=UPI00351AAE65